MFNLDPKKMEEAMKKMGISQETINASKVIIEKDDDKRIIIENPSVTKIKAQGQESFQISGNISEEISISEEDSVNNKRSPGSIVSSSASVTIT